MQKREAKFTTDFQKWAKRFVPLPAVFEIKDTRGKKTFPLKEVKEHQINALLASSRKNYSLSHKLPDSAYGYKPFDVFILSEVSAYLVIKYPKKFFVIDIETFIKETNNLTEERAKEIATFSG